MRDEMIFQTNVKETICQNQSSKDPDKGKYRIPLVPPITLLIDDPISFTVSAASFKG